MLIFMLAIFGFGIGCEPKKKSTTNEQGISSLPDEAAQSSFETSEPEPKEELFTQAQQELYKKDFPSAFRYEKQLIPKKVLREQDRSNNVYFEVFDKQNQLIGYLREFMGPVSFDEECACSPLSLTLTFNSDKTLRNILSVAPLQKYGHEPLTTEEHQQMVDIAKNPSPELLALSDPHEVIDGATGATKLTYKDNVVHRAGYSSWRIATLAKETRDVIEGTAVRQDQRRFQDLVMYLGEKDPVERRETMINAIEEAESDYLKQKFIRLLADTYFKDIANQAEPDARVEEAIFHAELGSYAQAEVLLKFCMNFAQHHVSPSFVSSCIQKLEQNEHQDLVASKLQLIKGFALLGQKKEDKAIPLLSEGLNTADVTLDFRAEMAVLFQGLNQPELACAQWEQIYLEAPLWPDLMANFAACGVQESIVARLDQQRKEATIAQATIKEPKKMSVLELYDESDVNVDLNLTEGEKTRVLLFFATWCPHCQAELPRIIAFYTSLQESVYKDNVELVVVRTAISRESFAFFRFQKDIFHSIFCLDR